MFNDYGRYWIYFHPLALFCSLSPWLDIEGKQTSSLLHSLAVKFWTQFSSCQGDVSSRHLGNAGETVARRRQMDSRRPGVGDSWTPGSPPAGEPGETATRAAVWLG